ncbi:hypothetical protein A6P55_25510 (plasmid) [Pandoraea pnomenusa]|nr:hypothetical protein A6P55_25510 [Pandoraea pnomenusa]
MIVTVYTTDRYGGLGAHEFSEAEVSSRNHGYCLGNDCHADTGQRQSHGCIDVFNYGDNLWLYTRAFEYADDFVCKTGASFARKQDQGLITKRAAMDLLTK